MSMEETMELIIDVMQFADSWERQRYNEDTPMAETPLLLAYEGLLT